MKWSISKDPFLLTKWIRVAYKNFHHSNTYLRHITTAPCVPSHLAPASCCWQRSMHLNWPQIPSGPNWRHFPCQWTTGLVLTPTPPHTPMSSFCCNHNAVDQSSISTTSRVPYPECKCCVMPSAFLQELFLLCLHLNRFSSAFLKNKLWSFFFILSQSLLWLISLHSSTHAILIPSVPVTLKLCHEQWPEMKTNFQKPSK